MTDRCQQGEQARQGTEDGRDCARPVDRPKDRPTLEDLHARAESARKEGAALMAKMKDLASKIEAERARRRAVEDERK